LKFWEVLLTLELLLGGFSQFIFLVFKINIILDRLHSLLLNCLLLDSFCFRLDDFRFCSRLRLLYFYFSVKLQLGNYIHRAVGREV